MALSIEIIELIIIILGFLCILYRTKLHRDQVQGVEAENSHRRLENFKIQIQDNSCRETSV